MNTLIIDLALLKSNTNSYIALLPDVLIKEIAGYIAYQRLYKLKYKDAIVYTAFALNLEDFIQQYLNYVKNMICVNEVCYCNNCLYYHFMLLNAVSNVVCKFLSDSQKLEMVEILVDIYLDDIPSFIQNYEKKQLPFFSITF